MATCFSQTKKCFARKRQESSRQTTTVIFTANADEISGNARPHPGPLPRGEGTSGACFCFLGCPSDQSSRGFFRSAGNVKALSVRRGLGEGGRETNLIRKPASPIASRLRSCAKRTFKRHFHSTRISSAPASKSGDEGQTGGESSPRDVHRLMFDYGCPPLGGIASGGKRAGGRVGAGRFRRCRLSAKA